MNANINLIKESQFTIRFYKESLNNKYIKSMDTNDKEVYKEVKAMKISGYTNIAIGGVGLVCSAISFILGNVSKTVVIIFVMCIALLSVTQYILNKKIRS